MGIQKGSVRQKEMREKRKARVYNLTDAVRQKCYRVGIIKKKKKKKPAMERSLK